jgi:hypothetical protein
MSKQLIVCGVAALMASNGAGTGVSVSIKSFLQTGQIVLHNNFNKKAPDLPPVLV